MPSGLPIEGVVLADHLKSVDWNARRAEFAGEAPPRLLLEVMGKLSPLLDIGA